MASRSQLTISGRFLHASLQLEALQDCFTSYDVMQTLHAFPEKIEDVYRQTFERILHSEPRQASLAQRALLWVSNAARSMTIDELRHALATSPDTCEFELARLMPEAVLMTACRGLMTIDGESRLVRLVRTCLELSLELHF
jgi:ankyrin repeat domain-containing protein 50